jgi:hypothetical protein
MISELSATKGIIELKRSKFSDAEATLQKVIQKSHAYDHVELRAFVTAYLTLVYRWLKNRN